MNKSHNWWWRASLVAGLLLLVVGAGQPARAGTWHNIEPLKSRRADVERELGRPAADEPVAPDTLRFKVAGGRVTVSFVTPKFVQTKKLPAALVGTVLEIVLQHDAAADTPDSMGLTKNNDFQRDERGAVVVFRNLKDGLAYTFIEGRLRTTRYSPSTDELVRAQVKG
ncbi:MAG TPA: hypothetical protein VF546_08085 [Pyrinomonadaceae bacterium]|jgi:hypothetical protein